MKITQLRNATIILQLGEHRLLVDPMFSEVGAMSPFRAVSGRRRNPLVPLPAKTNELLEGITGVVITHEHPDHFDPPALSWAKERSLPVWANHMDVANLQSKGLDARLLKDGVLGMTVEVIPSRHGRGPLGWLMGPVAGYYFAHPDEPSVYLTGDSILTDSVLEAVERLQPDLIVAPAGGANMGIGGNILFSVDDLVALIKRSSGEVLLNHLEALDHCATTRAELRTRMAAEGFQKRVFIPDDGEEVEIGCPSNSYRAAPQAVSLVPGFQKWLTAKLAGT